MIISLLVGALITAAATDTLNRVGAGLVALAAAFAAFAYLLRRGLRALKIVEALGELPETIAQLKDDVEALKEADEAQAQDHGEVKRMLARLDGRIARALKVSSSSQRRVTALARDLGVEFRDDD